MVSLGRELIAPLGRKLCRLVVDRVARSWIGPFGRRLIAPLVHKLCRLVVD